MGNAESIHGSQKEHFNAYWEWQRSQLNLKIGDNVEQHIPFHREVFQTEFPDARVRAAYLTEHSPRYTGLVAEAPSRVDEVLAYSRSGKALVIAASGISYLLAMMHEADEIDVVDYEPAQIAYVYAVSAFIALTSKHELLTKLKRFRATQYSLYDYFSMELPEERSRYLDQLPTLMDLWCVPRDLRLAIEQCFNYVSFFFDSDMQKDDHAIWERFLKMYDEIQDRVSTLTGINFFVEELTQWMGERPDTYQTIYTSNVCGFDGQHLSVEEFAQTVESALKPGGIGNIYKLQSFAQPNLISSRVLSHESHNPLESRKNWLVIQKQ